MNTGEVDQKIFWYLVNKLRKLEIGKKLGVIHVWTETGIKCEPKELTDAWAEHFEETPSVSSGYNEKFRQKIENEFPHIYAASFCNNDVFLKEYFTIQ